MPSELPAHASPNTSPVRSPRPTRHRFTAQELALGFHESEHYHLDDAHGDQPPPPSLLSPAFTPPSTPGTQTPSRGSRAVLVDSTKASGPRPKLLDSLPEVECIVRARIPTTGGQEMFLHLYTNNADNKEHLAIVFGSHIRSKSLDKERPGETEMDRMIRGAYTGRLYPGRTTSRRDSSQTSSPALIDGARKVSGYQTALKTSEALLKDSDMPSQRPRQPVSPPSPPNISDIKARPPSNEDLESLNSSIERVKLDDIPEGSRPTPPLVRIHSECYTGETVWSARCDCGEQLDEAARLMSLPTPVISSVPASSPDLGIDSPRDFSISPPSGHFSPLPPSLDGDDMDVNPGGVIVYLRQEGRGIGLSEKLKAYNLQDLGNDTVEANILLRHPADARTYGLATAILVDLGLDGERGIRLLTNNPDKIRAVEGPNREIIVRERVAMIPIAWKTGGREGIRSTEVESYLRTKIQQMGHMISDSK